MVENKDITIIIPIHEWNEDIHNMTLNAISSIPSDCNLIISTKNGSGVEFKYCELDSIESGGTFAIVFNNESSSFQSLVNTGVNNVKTEWFSILEFDDEYSPIWFDNFRKYQEYNQKYNIFLPLNDLYDAEHKDENGNDTYVGNGNEAAWASSFSDEMGVIDEKSVTDFFDFYFTGAIINKKMWDTIGGLKDNIKLTFWYEWILRAEHKGEKAYVVPKVGYAHTLGRENSLMMQYRATITPEESDFWYKTSKKESYISPDVEREINYVPKSKN